MSDQAFTPEQREEIKKIVHEALTEFFRGYGAIGKNIIVTAAVIVGSLAVIGGGLRWFISVFGFVITRQ